MQKRTGDELKEARLAAAKRFYEIGLRMLKESGVEKWTFHEKGLHGRGSKKVIRCPKPTTRRRLYILAHECAHASLDHRGVGKGQPTHRVEYEAELYAHEAMRRHGVAVPRKVTDAAKRYVAYRIDLAVRRHTRKLDRDAVEWSREYHRAPTRRALESGRIELVDMSRKRGQLMKAAGAPRVKATRPKRKAVTLAAALRRAASESGLSVNQLAKAAHLDQSALNRFLNGTRANIRLDVADKLLAALGLELVGTRRQGKPESSS